MQRSSIEKANVTAEGSHFSFCDNAALRGPSRQPRVCFEERVWSLKPFLFLVLFHQRFKRKCRGSSKPWESTRGHISVLFQGVGGVCVGVCVSERDANEGKSTWMSILRLLIADERKRQACVSRQEPTRVYMRAYVETGDASAAHARTCTHTHVQPLKPLWRCGGLFFFLK